MRWSSRSVRGVIRGLDHVLPIGVRAWLIWRIRPLLYRGAAVECPCCGGRFGRFMTHRDVPNVRCPRCGAMERHRLLVLWLDENPEFLAGVRRILHVAPEPPIRDYLMRLGDVDYITVDLMSPNVTLRCNVEELPFRDDWFDLVICNHVLEHVADDRRAMRELHRVLAPDGRAVLLCPIARGRVTTLEDPTLISDTDRLRVYGQEDHARLYGSDYEARLSKAGFDATVERYLDRLDGAAVARHQLQREHELFDVDNLYFARAR